MRHKRNRNRISAADHVVAKTAGADTWKTWSGRKEGSDNFEMKDLFLGMKRSIDNRLFAGPPPKGTTCPVCFCEPDGQDDWHTTWCGHSVCIDCFQAYASSQVNDSEFGLLKCPVCSQVLRRRDSVIALGGNKELIEQWDKKLRNQLLRALPSFRPCPKCSELDSANTCGGGFVTSDCLRPHYDERRKDACLILRGRNMAITALVCLYLYMVSYIANDPSKSVSIDLYCMMVPIYVFIKAAMATQRILASIARKQFYRPIKVECPCCDGEFALPAESEILNDEETSRWIKSYTRPCPACKVPIVKSGGCNHMKCSHCHTDFCWACMRLKTTCAAFNCHHGAPYHNAVPGLNTERRPAPTPGDSLATNIDYFLSENTVQLSGYDVLLVLVCLFGRRILYSVIRIVVAMFSGSFFVQIAVSSLAIILGSRLLQSAANGMRMPQHNQYRLGVAGARPPRRRPHQNPLIENSLNRFEQWAANNLDAVEQQMIAEALRRSMQER